MIFFAVIFALLLGVCVFFALPRTGTTQRVISVATYVLLIGIVYAGSVDLLGSPKPMRLEWRMPGQATVLAARVQEGEAIYLWLQTPTMKEPRAYALPWDMQMAQQLQNAMQEGESGGRAVRMEMAGGGSGDGVPKFYAQPHQALPDKDREVNRPVVLEQADRAP